MKEGKIDKKGDLWILRGKKLKRMDCRGSGVLTRGFLLKSFKVLTCCDHCSLFGEPEPYPESRTTLEICRGRILAFDKFTDERG